MTLLAFAAERRAAVRRAAMAPSGRRCKSILPARRARSSNPPHAAADGTDGQTDGHRTVR